MSKGGAKKKPEPTPERPEIPADRLEFTVRENREIEQMHAEISALLEHMGPVPVLIAAGALLQWIKSRIDDDTVSGILKEAITIDMQASQFAQLWIAQEQAKNAKKLILPGGTPGGLVLPK